MTTGKNSSLGAETAALAPDVEVSIEIEHSTLYNKDLAPVPKARRTWRVGSFVACGWFGIQTWIGGAAIYKILGVFFPGLTTPGAPAFLGITLAEFVCFLFFWAINMFVVYKGIESIRFLLNIKAPLLIALGLLLLAWAYRNAGGFGPILARPSAFDPGQPKAGQFWSFFVPGLTGMIGFWATLSLNIPHFSRYARSQRDQVVGQALGLPLTMALYSFIGGAVTAATTIIYGQAILDPVDVLTKC